MTCFHTDWTTLCGPYKSHEDMGADMKRALERFMAPSVDKPEFRKKEEEAYSILEDGLSKLTWLEPTLTHIDSKPDNIMIQEIDDGPDWEVTLIDWECCGWLPAYMQAVTWEESFIHEDLMEDGAQKRCIQKLFGPLDQYQDALDLFYKVADLSSFAIF